MKNEVFEKVVKWIITISCIYIVFIGFGIAIDKTIKMEDIQQQERRNMITAANIKKETVLKKEAPIYEIKSNKERRGVDRNSDVSNKYITITESEMDELISTWEKRIGYRTAFHNKGRTFLIASRESGLDPLYLFAHAAVESGWGKSHYAVSRGNYFGIAAYDHNPDAALHLGETVNEGIVSGAVWISKNFYSKGGVSLLAMKARGYATSKNWIPEIEEIWNQSYAILNGIKEKKER